MKKGILIGILLLFSFVFSCDKEQIYEHDWKYGVSQVRLKQYAEENKSYSYPAWFCTCRKCDAVSVEPEIYYLAKNEVAERKKEY